MTQPGFRAPISGLADWNTRQFTAKSDIMTIIMT